MIIIIKTSMKVVGELLHKNNMINNILSSHYEKIIVAMVT